jgi:hypothetical protein
LVQALRYGHQERLSLPLAQLVERRAALRQACEALGREPIPTRMSFRVELSTITGNAPPTGKERPAGGPASGSQRPSGGGLAIRRLGWSRRPAHSWRH